MAALDSVLSDIDPAIYLFKDFHPFAEEQRCNLAIIRRLKDVAYQLRDSYKTVVIVSPFVRLAPELMKDVTLVEMPPPGVEDFGVLLEKIKDDLKDKPQIKINLDDESPRTAANAARGLTLKEAENVFAKTLVMDGRLRCRRRARGLRREAADHPQERPAGILRDRRGLRPPSAGWST